MTELEELKAEIEEIKNEYLKQLEEIKAKIEEIEQEHESEEKTDHRWKPKKDEDFWWVDGEGSVWGGAWQNDKTDNGIFNHSDVFITEEEAYLDKERKQIRRELMKYSNGFDPNRDNWDIYYNYRDKTIDYWCSTFCYHPFVIYFESKEMAEKAVEEDGSDRIKRYLFGVG